MKVGTWRKRPVVVEAVALTPDVADAVAEWCGGYATAAGVVVRTLEGELLASWGDWVIRGVAGEHYPCKPEVFAATYEVAG